MLMRSLTIERFRGFERFLLKGLGRVNLIVGTNNSGKTTILEAANILLEGPAAIHRTLVRRGEEIWLERAPDGENPRHVEVGGLFHGREARAGSSLRIAADAVPRPLVFDAIVQEAPPGQPPLSFGQEPSLEADQGTDTTAYSSISSYPEIPFTPYPSILVLKVDSKMVMELPMLEGGAVPARLFYAARLPARPPSFNRAPLITTSSLTAESVTVLFNKIVLTPDEEFVYEALRVIEPSIERIAPAGPEGAWRAAARSTTRGGMMVRCRGVSNRIPIGSMGDGLWRMLGLALALVDARGGLLLIDEIDTGLHYTVMEEMWRLVLQSAKRLNVQVLATTHSRDCTESLAAICDDEVGEGSEVTIQRVERGQEEAVAYSEREIVAAARYGGEVR